VASFIENDINLVMSLEGVLMECSSRFEPADIDCLRDIIAAAMPSSVPTAKAQYRMVEPTQLEKQEFDIWLSRVEHEKGTVQSHRQKARSHDTYLYFKRLEHRISRSKDAGAAAAAVCDPDNKHCKVYLESAAVHTGEKFAKVAEEIKAKIMKDHMLTQEESVTQLTYCNWMAMSLFHARMVKAQKAAFVELVAGCTTGCCA